MGRCVMLAHPGSTALGAYPGAGGCLDACERILLVLGHRHHLRLLGAVFQMQQDAALLLDRCVPAVRRGLCIFDSNSSVPEVNKHGSR